MSGWLYSSPAFAGGFWWLVWIPIWICRSREPGHLEESTSLWLGALEVQEEQETRAFANWGAREVVFTSVSYRECATGPVQSVCPGVLLNCRHVVASGVRPFSVCLPPALDAALCTPSRRFHDSTCASSSPFCFLSVVTLLPIPCTLGFPRRISVVLPG